MHILYIKSPSSLDYVAVKATDIDLSSVAISAALLYNLKDVRFQVTDW